MLEPVLVGDVAPDGVERLAGDVLRDFERVFAGEFVGREGDELAGGEVLVAHHVPEGVPEEQALERRLEPVDLLAHERERAEVERDLGEGVVAVVGEHRRRRGRADQVLNDGLRAIEVDRRGVAEDGAVVAGVVDRDLGPVRAQARVLPRRGLADGERVDLAPVGAPIGRERV